MAEYGTSVEATAIRAWEGSSVRTYTSQLSILARTEQGDGAPIKDLLGSRLTALARAGASGSSAKALVSGIRMLERLELPLESLPPQSPCYIGSWSRPWRNAQGLGVDLRSGRQWNTLRSGHYTNRVGHGEKYSSSPYAVWCTSGASLMPHPSLGRASAHQVESHFSTRRSTSLGHRMSSARTWNPGDKLFGPRNDPIIKPRTPLYPEVSQPSGLCGSNCPKELWHKEFHGMPFGGQERRPSSKWEGPSHRFRHGADGIPHINPAVIPPVPRNGNGVQPSLWAIHPMPPPGGVLHCHQLPLMSELSGHPVPCAPSSAQHFCALTTLPRLHQTLTPLPPIIPAPAPTQNPGPSGNPLPPQKVRHVAARDHPPENVLFLPPRPFHPKPRVHAHHRGQSCRFHCHQNQQTMPHTLAMRSQRLRGATNSRTGDPCSCAHHPHPSVLERLILQAAKSVSSKLKTKVGVLVDLLMDFARLAWNRTPSLTRETAPSSSLLEQTLQVLAQEGSSVVDVSPTDSDISPTQGSSSPVNVELAGRGLGLAGSVPIPLDLWSAVAPPMLSHIASASSIQPHSNDPALFALANRLLSDGLLLRAPPDLKPNARAFLIPKTTQKCSLIVDMRPFNALCGPPVLKLQLPSLDELAALMHIVCTGNLKLFFTKLDVSNHFWSCKVPSSAQLFVRFGVCGEVFAIPSLAFGWSHSPVLAQMILGMYLANVNPGTVVIIQYVDDILLVSMSRDVLERTTISTVATLEDAGWIMSPKSVVEPSCSVVWMGKDIEGSLLTIANRPSYVASLLGFWLRLATRGYSKKTLRRLVGKIIWATRPGRAAYPFLAGCFAWLRWGPEVAAYTPPKVLRGLMEAMAVALHPWRARVIQHSGERWYVDASRQHGVYFVGAWLPRNKPQTLICPRWVQSQQSAELFALEVGIRRAANQGRSCITLVTYNLAAALSAVKGKASIVLSAQNRILRRMQHLLRWSGMQVFIEWVPSHCNPADPPSRWAEFASLDALAAKSLEMKARPCRPRYMGCMLYRG